MCECKHWIGFNWNSRFDMPKVSTQNANIENTFTHYIVVCVPIVMTMVAAVASGDSETVLFPIHIQMVESSGFWAFLSPTPFPLVGLQFSAFQANDLSVAEYAIRFADNNGYRIGDVINYGAYIEVKFASRTFMIQADASYTISCILRTLTASTNNLPSKIFSGFRLHVPLTCTIHTHIT